MELLLLVVAKLVQKVVVQDIGTPFEPSMDFEVICLSSRKEILQTGAIHEKQLVPMRLLESNPRMPNLACLLALAFWCQRMI